MASCWGVVLKFSVCARVSALRGVGLSGRMKPKDPLNKMRRNKPNIPL